MAKFRIRPSAGLHEWVAEEKGYFADEGLDYEIVPGTEIGGPNAGIESANRTLPQVTTGAFETIEAGPTCDISMACHWAVNMASSAKHGRMWGHAYMVAFAGIMVPPESPIRKPEDLRGVEIGVGYHSGGHFSCLQALEPFISPKEVRLSFIGGAVSRLDLLLERKIPAVNMVRTEKDILDQLGFRKIVETAYMQGFLMGGDAPVEECQKYFNALQRAQRDIDATPERYKEYFHYFLTHLTHLSEKYRDQVDVRGFTTGKRVVFEPYTQEVYESTHRWMEELQIFPEGQLGHADYSQAVMV